MKIKTSELKTVCGVTSKFPEETMPEIAFAGRSNVGKSSLINGLLNRKNLARTSSEPGKTVTINFYEINNEFFFVDLPGYGYAKASVETRAKWGKMIEKYLNGRNSLVAVILLVDMRHTPTKDDVHMFQWVKESGFTPIIIATKKDKVKKSLLQKNLKEIRKTFGCGEDVKIFPFSALNKEGKEEILDEIERLTSESITH